MFRNPDYRSDEGLLRLTLNRPKQINAFTVRMADARVDLQDRLDDPAIDRGVRDTDGRVARAFIAVTECVIRLEWTIDSVADNIDVIRDQGSHWILPTVPSGYSYDRTRTSNEPSRIF